MATKSDYFIYDDVREDMQIVQGTKPKSQSWGNKVFLRQQQCLYNLTEYE